MERTPVGPHNWGSYVMRSSILIGLTSSMLIFSVWAVNLVCYHPHAIEGLDPLAPISMTVALNN
jgi:hypothetical protein